MFAFKLASFLAVASIAFAHPTDPVSKDSSSCSTGTVSCCNSVTPVDSSGAALISGLLGIVLGDINVPIGLNCIAVPIIGVADSCSAEAACCSNINNEGLIPIGIDCSPINVAL
ncbi:hypothetical protein EW145_g7141 [Phellinidium pouzarii]|uniref:Hydrophobin n=1 Tax=Phellinidium pouzarii TaxID=167371 RepID=A0A4V3XB00_9AGAM|nr:hypothetical protein EW145_g7141 [Phellinidium pouzarii]